VISHERRYHTGFSAFQVPPVQPGDAVPRRRIIPSLDLGKFAGLLPRLPVPLDFAVI